MKSVSYRNLGSFSRKFTLQHPSVISHTSSTRRDLKSVPLLSPVTQGHFEKSLLRDWGAASTRDTEVFRRMSFLVILCWRASLGSFVC